jgi:capsular polysaccharide biosynthesis protein
MKNNYKLNISLINPKNLSIGTLERLKRGWFGQIYRTQLKSIPFVRATLIQSWRYLFPLYASIVARLHVADPTKAWRPLIKMHDFVLANRRPCKQIYGPMRVETPVPKVLPAEDQALLLAPHDHYVFPAVYVAELGQAIVCGGSNFVFVDGEVICHDLYDFERDYTSEEMHGRHLIDPKANRMRLLDQDPTPEEIDCAASFLDACAANYAHWMTEVLPRVAVFCDVTAYAEVPIIVNAELHPNIMQSLALVVGDQRKVMVLPVGRSIKVNNLVQTSVTGYVPFEKRNKQLAGHGQGVFNPLALKSLKEKLKIRIGGEFQKSSEKVYLQRTSGLRNVVNTKEIDKIISEADYSFNDPGLMNFIDQVGLLVNSSKVIAATGAALCNAIFCDRSISIFILMGKHDDMIYRYWANMLQPLDLNVNYILGEQSNSSEKSIHGNFKIDAVLLKEII